MSNEDKFFTVGELVSVRRWKRSEITRLLGRPDRIVPGVHKRPAHLYGVGRVIAAEMLYKPFRGTRRNPNQEVSIVKELLIGGVRVFV